jgi:signal transduction histidine kinase
MSEISVLLIEDEEDHATLVENASRRNEKWKLHRWIDSLKQLPQCKNEPVDLILLDLNLPGSQGLDSLKFALKNLPGTPVIVLTSVGDLSLATEAISIGASDYIIKSELLQANTLTRSICYAVERHHLLKQLNVRNEILRNFASNAAHEIKAPLRHITFFSSLLSEKNTLKGDEKKYIETIDIAAQKLSTLVEDLLNYARYGSITFKNETIELNALIDEITNELELSIEKRYWKVNKPGEVFFAGDPTHIKVLFKNLISNSIKFNTSECAQVEISAIQKDRNYTISLKDNGIGFDTKHAQQIFQTFSRLNPQYPGTGLGLALCKRIIEEHRGTIWAESELGKGSIFHLRIPKDYTK